jgi:zinc protease
MRPVVSHALPRIILALVLVLLAPIAAPTGAKAASGPQVSHFTLENGFEVVVIPDHRTPVVTHMVWYKVGSADETAGKTGLAHFLEHLMFKGTKNHPMGEFSQTVSTIGGQENAFTTSDYTAYFQRTAREHLKTLMDFESDRMTGLVLTDDVVRPELAVVLEEQNMRIANNPGARLEIQMDAALYLNQPYHHPVIGWRNEIEALTRDDALDFYLRFYTPNNAVLVVAGDVTAEEVKTLAEETYGKVRPVAEIGARARPQEPEPEAPRTITLSDSRVAQPSLQRFYLVPSYTTAKPAEAEALDVLAHVLGHGSNSRLYQELVVEQGLAVNAGAGYEGTSLDATKLRISAAPKPGTSLAQLEDAVDSVIAEVVEKGVSADELERSKSRMIADAIYAQDNQSTLARWYGTALTTGSSVEDVQSWPDRIRAVTAEQVQDAARRWFDKRRSVTGYLVKDAQTVEKRP